MVDDPIISLRDVSRQYGTDPPVHALRSVQLDVHRGEWLAIVGPSGSGKSTLLNILGCLDLQTSGTYHFCGHDVVKLTDRQRAGLRCRGIGFVFQSFHLLSHRSAMDNVMLAEIYRHERRGGRRERAAAALEKVRLSHRAESLPSRLSGGERQRVAIARALVGAPQMLLCDEPTGNLDSATAAAILDVFGVLHGNGLTIVMITHDRDVADRAGRRVRISDGMLVETA